MNACEHFIDGLLDLLHQRGTLARYRTGFELLRLVKSNYGSGTDARALDTSGFRHTLVANNQCGQAIRHLRLQAGCILLGPPGWVLGAVMEMIDLLQARQGRAESQTELEDNAAGREIGHILVDAFEGASTEATRERLHQVLAG